MSEIQADPVIQRRNDALIQRQLNQYERMGMRDRLELEEIGRLAFFEIPGITRFWDEDEKAGTLELMSQIIAGLADNNAIFVFLLTGTGSGVSFRLGVS